MTDTPRRLTKRRTMRRRPKYVLSFEHDLTQEQYATIRARFRDFINSPEQRAAVVTWGGTVTEIHP